VITRASEAYCCAKGTGWGTTWERERGERERGETGGREGSTAGGEYEIRDNTKAEISGAQ